MRSALILAGPLLVGVCLLCAAQDQPKTPARTTAPAGKATTQPKVARPEIEQAIQAQIEAFSKAFDAGDAPAVALLFTDDAQVIDEQGTVVKGRDAITGLFASSFAAKPGAKIQVTTDSIRPLGPDVAVEEGRARILPASGGSPETTRYTVIYVKQDGKWLQSSVREHTDRDITHHERLQELAWMVGEWVDESNEAIVFTTCDWSSDKNFLLREFHIQIQGKVAMTGTQRVGWDPSHKQIRSWVFDSEGGFGEGFWYRNGDQWLVKSIGVLRDGRTATATHVITPMDKHMMRWKSVDRTEGGQAVPDIDEFVMVRKPPKPQTK